MPLVTLGTFDSMLATRDGVRTTMTFLFSMRSAVQLLLNLMICSSLVAATVTDATDAFVDDALKELGFEAAQKGDLESGKIISVGLPDIERQPTELMVGGAMMLVRRPLAAVSQVLTREDTFRVNTKILDFGEIGDGSASREELHAIFDEIAYTEAESKEAGKLLKAKPGERFNLSKEEIDKYRSLQSVDGRAHLVVSSALAEMLQRRFLVYLEGGLAAVEPYERKAGKRASPRQELTIAFSSLKLVQKHFPTFYASLSGFPAQLPEDTESRFFWIKRLAKDRPAFALAHRLVERKADYTVAMDLQYYAQHSYNSMLTLVACVPHEEGTLVISSVRIFTDRVTGFASGIRKGVGRKRVAEAMAEYFRDMRQVLEGE
jgi:hypothetical protein